MDWLVPAWQRRRTMPVARRDEPWRGTSIMVMAGPFDLPSRATVVDAVATLMRAFPQRRLGWQLDAEARRWVWDPADVARLADAMVTEVAWDHHADIGAQLSELASAHDAAWPLNFVLSGQYLGLRMSHVLGDGATVLRYLTGVLRVALTGDMPAWPEGEDTTWVYARAVSSVFLRSPRAVRRVFADARSGRGGAVPPGAEQPGAEQPGAEQPALEQPWQPMPRTVCRIMSAHAYSELKAWRKLHSPGLSNPALELSLSIRALSAVGIALDPAVLTLFDLRRYLPSRHIDGNFVVGIALPMDAETEPSEIHQAMARAGTIGRPLAAGTASLLRNGRPPLPSAVAVDAPIRLAFSHAGRPMELERLPWLSGSVRRWVGSIDPGAPDAMTVAVCETGRLPQFSITYHANVVDPAKVARALDLIVRQPVSLLGTGVADKQAPVSERASP